MAKFKVLNGCEKLKNADKIFPLKQRELLNVVEGIKEYVKRIIVFGSSTNWNCNYNSDIDLIVEPNEKYDDIIVSKKLSKIAINGYDLFTTEQLNNASDLFRDEIKENGVLIYE